LLLSASILTSASASTQTTILPTARTALSMAAYRAIPQKFARIHPKFFTPTWSTIAMGLVSALFYLLFTVVNTNLLTALIGSVGLMIAFYYGLTGFACVWFYRRTLLKTPRDLLMQGIIPLLGGIILFGAFIYGLIQYAAPDWLTDTKTGANITIFGIGAVADVGIGALALGGILMLAQRAASPRFFRGETLPRNAAELVLVPAGGVVAHLGLPDSGEMPTVIAPDLFNLPQGGTALDTETGERFNTGNPPPD
jgi:amino acid transporter